jgi:predicted transcriptional regulator
MAAFASDLRRFTARFERLIARDGRSINQQILDTLADVGPLSTSAVARLIRRRRADVLATLKLMYAAGQIARRDDKWEVIDG